MNNGKFKRYAIKAINLLEDLVGKVKLESDKQKEEGKNYIQGLMMGYYSIITLLKHEAFVFCISQKELGLADIIPDVDLLGLSRNPDVDDVEDNWAINDMHEENIKGYLIDSIILLKDRAIEAKKEADHPKEGFEEYNKGELMAYCSWFSLLKHQASAFNIDEKEIGITDIDSSGRINVRGC